MSVDPVPRQEQPERAERQVEDEEDSRSGEPRDPFEAREPDRVGVRFVRSAGGAHVEKDIRIWLYKSIGRVRLLLARVFLVLSPEITQSTTSSLVLWVELESCLEVLGSFFGVTSSNQRDG